MRLSRVELRDRWRECRDLINAWDPLGVLAADPEWPRDEYECVVGPVLRALESGAGARQVARLLAAEVSEHMGVATGEDEALSCAQQLTAWYQARWPGTGPVPAGG
jgi:hypothetical protein